MYKISIQYTNPFKRYRTETIFQSWKFFKVEKGHNFQNFTLNQTWPTFYDYIPVCKISIQYTNPFKRYRTETKSVTYGTDGRDGTDVCTDSGDTICPPFKMAGA